MQQLVSFIHAFFVNEHFFRERRAPGPSRGLWPAGGRAHTRSCLGGPPRPARRPTRKSRKPSPAESGCGGKDTGFGRDAVAGSCAPGHVTGPRQPKSCHPARREPRIWGGGGAPLSGGSGDQKAHAARARPVGGSSVSSASKGHWLGRAEAGGAQPELGRRAQRPPYGKRAAWLRPPEGAWRGSGARRRLPLPGTLARSLARSLGERVQGGAGAQSGRCGGPECGRGAGRGRGAWLRSALQCGGGNRFQFVLLLAQRALLAPGSQRSLSRLNPPS